MGNFEEKIFLFAKNTQALKKEFVWENIISKQLAALLCTLKNKEADCGAVRESHSLLKQHTGVFSAFRGNLAVCLAAMLSLSDDKEQQLKRTLDVHQMMKAQNFKSSDYLAVAAYQIAALAGPDRYLQVVQKSKAFYDAMKTDHPFITGKDDYIFAAMLGLGDIETRSGAERLEDLYRQLQQQFGGGGNVQSLSQVLLLGEADKETLERLSILRKLLHEKKCRLDREYTLSSLGMLAVLPVDPQTAAEDVSGAYHLLRAQKGFGVWACTKQQQLLYAASIVAASYMKEVEDSVLTASLSTSLSNMIIAQQAAMTASIVAVSAAASASASTTSSS